MCRIDAIGIWLVTHAIVIASAVSAIAAAIIAWFTVTLSRSTVGLLNAASEQGRLAQESIKLTRDEFRASHRPEIIVRNMHISGNDIIFTYYNIGRDDARNIKIQAFVYASKIGKISPNRRLISCGLDKRDLAPGSFGITTVGYAIDEAVGIGFAGEVNAHAIPEKERTVIHCVGMISYEDSRGMKRQMGFARYHDPETGRFGAIDDEEYEYSY